MGIEGISRLCSEVFRSGLFGWIGELFGMIERSCMGLGWWKMCLLIVWHIHNVGISCRVQIIEHIMIVDSLLDWLCTLRTAWQIWTRTIYPFFCLSDQ